MCWVSGGVLVIMMLLTVVHVVARPFNLAPVGVPEMIGYGMVIVVCFGFAYNAILKGNVAVDMLFYFPPQARGGVYHCYYGSSWSGFFCVDNMARWRNRMG